MQASLLTKPFQPKMRGWFTEYTLREQEDWIVRHSMCILGFYCHLQAWRGIALVCVYPSRWRTQKQRSRSHSAGFCGFCCDHKRGSEDVTVQLQLRVCEQLCVWATLKVVVFKTLLRFFSDFQTWMLMIMWATLSGIYNIKVSAIEISP